MSTLCKVLIVDDELIMRQGISHMIDWKQEGFELIGQASNGEEALEIIKQNPPNIVLTDVVMPKIDGIELIKSLENSYPDIKIIVLSSYSDFNYVKSSFKYGAIDYILKPTLNIDELLKTLKNASAKISGINLNSNTSNSKCSINSSFYNLINGTCSNNELSDLRKIFKFDSFCLFGTSIKVLNLNYESKNKLKNYILHHFENYNNDTIIFNEINLKDNLLLYLINIDAKKALYFKKELNELCLNLKNKYNDISFILSKSFISLKNLKDIYYNNFTKLSDISFYYKDVCFIDDSYFTEQKNNILFNFKEFYALTSQSKFDSSLLMLTECVNNAVNNKSVNKFELKSLIQNCIYNIVSTLESKKIKNIDELKKLKYKSFSLIEDSIYAQDLLANYKYICTEFENILKENFISFNSQMTDKIISYVYKNYSKPLTLAEVSTMFNFNYSYLSSYFGSHNNEGFNEFLNKIRIEKACEFLKQDIPISKICGMVGYSDHSYFTKVFKKFTGMTPSLYKKNSNIHM